MSQKTKQRHFVVVARVRPVSEEHEIAVSASDDQHVTVAVISRNRKALVPKQGGRSQGVSGSQSYEFNRVLGGRATQGDVCRAVDINSKVTAALDGFPVLVFAFGQTSAGKTHTVVGCLTDKGDDDHVAEGQSAAIDDAAESTDEQEGVMFTALRQGFVKARQQSQREFQISASAVEIYNERVVDLLNNRQELQIRHRRDRGFYLQGLRRTVCTDVAQATHVLKQALAYRRSRAHQMNESSSRSHAIITFHFDSWAAPGSAEAGEAARAEKLFSLLKRARKAHASATSDASRSSSSNGSVEEAAPMAVPSIPGQRVKRRMRKYGQLVFVDLAGSERLKTTGSHQGEGMHESCAINRSLFALGRVLHALSEKSQGRQQPVPIRDSSLTKILAYGLEYAAHTTMIACLNPMASQLGQSTSTLHFAKLALSIKTSPVARLDARDKMVMDLKHKISSLRKENQSLTKAFLWLCSGTADWNTLIRQLPEHVSQQLPACAPPLLSPAPSQSYLPGYLPCPGTSSQSSMATRPCTPAVTRPRTSHATPLQAGLPVATAPTLLPRTAPGSRRSSTMLKSSIENSWPPGMPSPSVYSNLLQFPALAALESEFQDFVSRPGTATQEEMLHVLNAASHGSRSLQPPMPADPTSSTPPIKGGPGSSLTPSAVRDVLDRSAVCDHVKLGVGASNTDAEWSAEGRQNSAHKEVLNTARDMEANALLWALKNLWFGVEEDMTEFAYKVHDRLHADSIMPSSVDYYDQLSTNVKDAFPDKWKTYSSQGCMLNTMSKQQGIINCAMTVETALSNRAAWASSRVASKSCCSVSDKQDLHNNWPRFSSGRNALVDELPTSKPAALIETGTVTACPGQAACTLNIWRRSTGAAPPVAMSHGLHSYMKPVRARLDSPICKPFANPARPEARPFSAGRCQTPGELMSQRIVSTLDLDNATESSDKGRSPVLGLTRGGLDNPSPGSLRSRKPQVDSQYRTCLSGGLRHDRRPYGPEIVPQHKAWNDCPNVEIPSQQGRL